MLFSTRNVLTTLAALAALALAAAACGGGDGSGTTNTPAGSPATQACGGPGNTDNLVFTPTSSVREVPEF